MSTPILRRSKRQSPTKCVLDSSNENTPNLNYSIVNDEEANDLKITLKLSKNQNKILKVILHNDIDLPKTPSKKRLNETPKTPKNKMKLLREGILTPSMETRKQQIKLETTPLMRAINRLHVSNLPQDLPCREKEFSDVYNFLEGKLIDGCGGCMYISGVPGTGKTATVTSVMQKLMNSAKIGEICEFQFVSINGMKLTEPRQTYVEIVKQLTGKTVPWEQAQSILDEKFAGKTKKGQNPVILSIDELDMICTRRQDVVYNLLDWPTKAKTQLIVITIANTMDLPERLLMNRVTSRLGLTRLTFQPYTHKQLQEIVMKRLCDIKKYFNLDAIQLVARKIASVSGDARRALDICRRAVEIAQFDENSTEFVNMNHINEALKSMITQPKVRAIKHCSKLEKFILQAIVAEIERTGIEETIFTDVYKMLISISALNGFDVVSCSCALIAIAKLSACKLLLTDQKCNDLDQKIILNVSIDDVYYALKGEQF